VQTTTKTVFWQMKEQQMGKGQHLSKKEVLRSARVHSWLRQSQVYIFCSQLCLLTPH